MWPQPTYPDDDFLAGPHRHCYPHRFQRAMRRITIFASRLDENRKTIRAPRTAILSSPITRQFLSEAAAWKPILKLHREEDVDWDWTELLSTCRELQRHKLARFESLALCCDRQVQALMILETTKHASRPSGKPLVYVEYLAAAPWNRPGIENPRRYWGCGRALLQHAVERSERLGRSGRVGLHALPGARAFYVSAGLKDFGPDPQEGGLHYLQING
jgi:hypothetical protein